MALLRTQLKILYTALEHHGNTANNTESVKQWNNESTHTHTHTHTININEGKVIPSKCLVH